MRPIDHTPARARTEITILRHHGTPGRWTTRDPRVAFAILLELERDRRAGASPPCVEVMAGPEVDGGFMRAVERHLPWLRVQRIGEGVVGAHGGDGPPPAMVPGGVLTPVSPQELAMLFGSVEGGGATA